MNHDFVTLNFGEGKIVVHIGTDNSGERGAIVFEPREHASPFGVFVPAGENHEVTLHPGMAALFFKDHGSLAALQTAVEELRKRWKPEDAPIPGPSGDGRTFAPFDERQVDALKGWQSCDWGHAMEHCSIPMSVHPDGLHCSACNALQKWVPSFCLEGPPPMPGILADSLRARGAKLLLIEAALSDYYLALDQRRHGGVAADQFLKAVESALGRQWEQGEETARRAAQPKSDV